MPQPVPDNEGSLRPGLRNLLSGIEAGIIGGLAMLAVLLVSSLLRRHVWWETPNLLGSTFYGSRAFRSGPGRATVAGTALHLVITGSVGAIFGFICGLNGARPRRRLVLLGILTGVVWYYLADAVFWKRVNPLVPLYSPQTAALLSHALFGACLGFMGQRYMGQRYIGQRHMGQRDMGPLGPREMGQTLRSGQEPPPLPGLDSNSA